MNDENKLKGTTTVGLKCKDGVVFATERRATMGNLIAHKVADKIFKIDDHIGATIAGGVGDAQSLMKYISAEVALYRLRNGARISVESAATLTANILHSSRFYPFYVQTLLGGVDDKGPSLFSLDPAGGVIGDDVISTGSGSPFAYGVLKTDIIKIYMSKKELKLLFEQYNLQWKEMHFQVMGFWLQL